MGESMNAYKNISYYYDEIMEVIEYDLWVEFVKPYLTNDSHILDLACGSGTFANSIANLGYKVSGLDLSEEIINIAKEKSKINHNEIDFQVKDMTTFDYNEKFDVITCFFDSINFLDETQIKPLFDSVYNNLKNDGYFIFDVFTYSKMKFFHKTTLKDNLAFAKYKWKMNVKNNILYHEIIIKDNNEKIIEKYKEYYHDYQKLLDKRFEVVKVVTDFKESLDLKNGERILVVLKK